MHKKFDLFIQSKHNKQSGSAAEHKPEKNFSRTYKTFNEFYKLQIGYILRLLWVLLLLFFCLIVNISHIVLTCVGNQCKLY